VQAERARLAAERRSLETTAQELQAGELAKIEAEYNRQLRWVPVSRVVRVPPAISADSPRSA
jgi:hypothetical protein